jgi:hypothetical protein
MVISDRPGQGKTHLMKEFMARCTATRTPVALVDLSDPQYQSPYQFASRVAGAMTLYGVQFERFSAARTGARAGVHGSATVGGDQHGNTAGVIIRGDYHEAVGSRLLDELAQVECAMAFLEDLVTASQDQRLVLIVDAYETEEADEVRIWFTSVLEKLIVHGAQGLGTLVVVSGVDLVPDVLPLDPLRELLGERFADVVWHRPRLSQWGPEDVRELFATYQEECLPETAALIADLMRDDKKFTVSYVAATVVNVLASSGTSP